jgi:hypothetical protein
LSSEELGEKIAQASLNELYYYRILSRDLGFIQDSRNSMNQIEETAKCYQS